MAEALSPETVDKLIDIVLVKLGKSIPKSLQFLIIKGEEERDDPLKVPTKGQGEWVRKLELGVKASHTLTDITLLLFRAKEMLKERKFATCDLIFQEIYILLTGEGWTKIHKITQFPKMMQKRWSKKQIREELRFWKTLPPTELLPLLPILRINRSPIGKMAVIELEEIIDNVNLIKSNLKQLIEQKRRASV